MSDKKPRRSPRRRSGEAIVTSLLDACEALLLEHDFESINTNLLAARAGVSVGSLYQYYPNKDAILAAVGRRLNKRILSELSEILLSDASVESRIARMVEHFVLESGPLEVRHALLRVASRQWEYIGLLETERELIRICEDVLRPYWRHMNEGELTDHTRMLFFATRGAVQGIMLHDPESLPRFARLLSGTIVNSIRSVREVR